MEHEDDDHVPIGYLCDRCARVLAADEVRHCAATEHTRRGELLHRIRLCVPCDDAITAAFLRACRGEYVEIDERGVNR